MWKQSVPDYSPGLFLVALALGVYLMDFVNNERADSYRGSQSYEVKRTTGYPPLSSSLRGSLGFASSILPHQKTC